MPKAFGAVLLMISMSSVPIWAQSESLLIGAGDTVQVQVFDTPEMQRDVRVTDAGDVPLPFIGQIHVAGNTPAMAARAIETALVQREIMVHPQVTVTVVQFATQKVSVMGEVRHPSALEITTPQPILSILSLVGGLTELADRVVTIQRRSNPSQQSQYYVSNNSRQALADSAAVLVYPGDTVIVPKAGIVYVLGDVGRPGGYPITTNDSKLTIVQAIALAGTQNTSKTSQIQLIRNTSHGQEQVRVHLEAIRKGKELDLTLQANDVLYVPFSWMKNAALSASAIAASTSSAAIYAIH